MKNNIQIEFSTQPFDKKNELETLLVFSPFRLRPTGPHGADILTQATCFTTAASYISVTFGVT